MPPESLGSWHEVHLSLHRGEAWRPAVCNAPHQGLPKDPINLVPSPGWKHQSGYWALPQSLLGSCVAPNSCIAETSWGLDGCSCSFISTCSNKPRCPGTAGSGGLTIRLRVCLGSSGDISTGIPERWVISWQASGEGCVCEGEAWLWEGLRTSAFTPASVAGDSGGRGGCSGPHLTLPLPQPPEVRP